ncbi:hypothetical protein [Rhodohalobacter sp. 8-1]|uniref:hypothetical protein n=1 Tax=Rhodohalobacter sp. 8-1 TaxID=3131972 RepID=UPI0030EEBCE4
MSTNQYTTVPEPPDYLSQDIRKTWYMAGLKMVKENRLDDEAYKLLKDLCYWEEQKLSTLEKLRAVQTGPGSAPTKMMRSVALKNLKTIKAEIDQIRSDLNIEQHESAWISDSQPISEEAYSCLPVPLASCCEVLKDPVNRDLFLLSFLPAIAAHIPNVVAEHADGFYTASLNIFLIDRSGTAETYSKQAVRYFEEPSRKITPGTPGLWSSVQAASSRKQDAGAGFWGRSHAIYQTTPQFTDEPYESEIKDRSLQDAVFREAFRVVKRGGGDGLYTLSNGIVGDIDHYRSFWSRFDSTILSSFLVYCGKKEAEWQSHRPDAASRALNQRLDELRDLLGHINTRLLSREEPLIAELADNQWQMIDDTFAEKMEIIEELALPPELKKANYKAAIYTLKLTIIFSVIRQFDEDGKLLTELEFLTPDDDDLIAALWIADTCLKHTIRAFEQLPIEAQPDARGDRYHKFYNVLPPAFETSEAVELAGKMNIANRTAKRYLNTLIDEQKLTRIRKGEYEKVG